LDIKEMPYVVNMTLPDEAEQYIHRIGRVGRADRMGLAVSFVATCREKVWYHKCANRGKGCSNTKLADQGGCTIWYDEPTLLKAIKKRLHMEVIPEMVATRGSGAGEGAAAAAGGAGAADGGAASGYHFALPAGMADGVVYGEERSVREATPDHVAAIQQHVGALAALETRAQNAYLGLKLRYGGGQAAAAAAAPARGGAGGASD
jgi:hypothetical protein